MTKEELLNEKEAVGVKILNNLWLAFCLFICLFMVWTQRLHKYVRPVIHFHAANMCSCVSNGEWAEDMGRQIWLQSLNYPVIFWHFLVSYELFPFNMFPFNVPKWEITRHLSVPKDIVHTHCNEHMSNLMHNVSFCLIAFLLFCAPANGIGWILCKQYDGRESVCHCCNSSNGAQFPGADYLMLCQCRMLFLPKHQLHFNVLTFAARQKISHRVLPHQKKE